MPKIVIKTEIDTTLAIAFDLSRSMDLHMASTAQTNEKAVAGRMTGLIEMGEQVTWEATHFGVRQRLTSAIVAFDRPVHFRDSMVKGAFKRFDHDHHFVTTANGVLMTDTFDYTSPLGPLGLLADWLFLENYMTKLLTIRNEMIKQVAESGEYKKYLPNA